MNEDETKRRKMLCLHDYETHKEIWCDPDAITVVRRLEKVPVDRVHEKEIPERTQIVVGRDNSYTMSLSTRFLVTELPGEIACAARWEIALPELLNRKLLAALEAALGTFDYKAKQKWPKVHAAGLAAIAKATQEPADAG